MKKFGDNLSVRVVPNGIFATNREDRPDYNIYVLHIAENIAYATTIPSVGRGFDAQITKDANRRIQFPPAVVNASIVVIDKQKHLELAKVPLLLRPSTRMIGLNWKNVVQGFDDYSSEAFERKSYSESNPFDMHIKHPWYEATITEIVEGQFGDVSRFAGHLLVESLSKAFVEVDPAKVTRKTDILMLRRLEKPLIRRYIIPTSAFFGERHPAEDLCFSYGLFGSAIYFAENNDLWQHGALYHSHAT